MGVKITRKTGSIKFGKQEIRITNVQLRKIIEAAHRDAKRFMEKYGNLALNAAYRQDISSWRVKELYEEMGEHIQQVELLNKLIGRCGLGSELELDMGESDV